MHRLLVLFFTIHALVSYGLNTKDTSWLKTHSQLRFHYANDVYNQTDRYLTQSAAFRFYTAYKQGRMNQQIRNIYAIQQNVYTPSDIFGDTIQRNDRPYASTLAFEYSHFIFHEHQRAQANFHITIGTIGKNALGEQMQREVHYAVNSRQALGWQYQVAGAPYINLQAVVETLTTRFKHLDHVLQAQINAGTVFNNVALGQVIRLHANSNYFEVMNRATINTFRVSVSMKNEIKLVGWNGTLQGALGTRNNPYTITGNAISRVVTYHQLAFHTGYRHLELTLSKSFLSREFHTGLKHKWCAIEFCYLF